MTRYLRKIAVSDVGMGCMGFSHGYGTVPDHDEAVDSIRAAYQAGCTFFDTAEGYGKERFFPGHNEQLVGEAVQNLYNMLERDCEQTIQPYCLENGIGLVPFSPIASGFLSGQLHSTSQFEKVDDVRNWVPQLSQENMDKNQPVIHLLNQFAEAKGVTTAQLSLAWMLAKYPNVVPIPGSKNRARILENLAAAQVDLAPVEMQRLDTALNELTIHGHRGTVEVENRQVGYNRDTHTKWTN